MLVFALFAVVFAIDLAAGSGGGLTLAMAGGGSIYRNAQVADGAGWDRKWSITSNYAALLENVVEFVSDDKNKILAWYNSSTVFSTNKAQYDGFPVGSIIHDIQAKTTYMHQTATTWVANAYA
jgi:hypothetical protein